MGDSKQDKRRAPRYSSRFSLDVSGAKAKLTDLSETGVGFVTEQPLAPGANVQVSVRHLPDDKHPEPMAAEVVRVERDAQGRYAVGARLGKGSTR
ncbi:MAG: PilZ domain-containing protein [Burkholderiales bacterium]|nr:PilZ domain-containing protein [Burkholderiales bacterium]